MNLKYRFYFLDELYSILRSHEFSHGWTFVPLRWLQIHIIHKRIPKEKKRKFEVKTFPWAACNERKTMP
jgi:hypothetical protein